MKKFFKLIFIVFIVCLLPTTCAAGVVAYEIFNSDYSKFSKQKILEILSKETLLFYSDGTSQLGSLFGQEHRIYIPIERIPRTMKDAIVSAEDEDFYHHKGINPKGIFRAMVHNLFSRSRQGASTITQQTVKNLYGRKETDLKTKFHEAINAFKLEKIYSKDQILEFYLNQFHVTGNGRGVGVAAKYYFNKNVEELNLVECAFIAGSVKGPEKYNPFTKVTLTAQERAKKEALIRKNYVLERMLKDKKISEKEYNLALNEQVPFHQGRFQYNELSVNQLVLKQISRPEVLKAIGVNNPDEIGTMGLRITTTIDKEIQSAAQYGLRQNLSRTQMILKGFSPESQKNFSNVQQPELHGFYVAKVSGLSGSAGNEALTLSLGVSTCLVDKNSLDKTAITLDQVQRKGLAKAKSILLSNLSSGSYVLASIKKIGPAGSYFCDLETRPKVQGASLVVDKGKLIAMAGGFSSNEYNRALYAQRQPGSTFKLPTYYAALQMGWSVLDPLSNIRDVFTWQGNFYFPRPDHTPSSLETTILGAGAKSENLASVWLLRHMLDKLSYSQFLELLKFLEITNENSSVQDTVSFIANKFNATPDNASAIKEGLLDKLKSDSLADLTLNDNPALRVFLRTLHYGTDFEKERVIIQSDSHLSSKEKALRNNIINNNLLRWTALANKAHAALGLLSKYSKVSFPLTENERQLLSGFVVVKNNDGSIGYISSEQWQPNLTTNLVNKIQMNSANLENWQYLYRSKNNLFNSTNILLDGVVPLALVDSINQSLQNNFASVMTKDPLEKLFYNYDFKYSLGMYYTAKMVAAMGISEPVQWVPSFPLGSNVVTLSNLALMYQTFLTGKTYRYFDIPKSNQLLVVSRIEDDNGNLLWEAQSKEYSFADNFYSSPILNTLRGTVTGGTGYSLNWNAILRSNDENLDQKLATDKIRVPVFAKTGTTNNYTNGTFIGFLPYPAFKGDNLSPDNAYTIATYIGYDSNEPMVHGWYKAYGGVAIPAWQEIALEIIKSNNYADKINYTQFEDNKSHLIPFKYGENMAQVVVPFHSGNSLSAIEPEEDDDSDSKNLYADDYSQNSKKTFRVWLEGEVSDNVFVPKRKVSFFSPYIYQSSEQNTVIKEPVSNNPPQEEKDNKDKNPPEFNSDNKNNLPMIKEIPNDSGDLDKNSENEVIPPAPPAS